MVPKENMSDRLVGKNYFLSLSFLSLSPKEKIKMNNPSPNIISRVSLSQDLEKMFISLMKPLWQLHT